MMATSNAMADRDEDFNTRYGSYRGWQKAISKVKPIPRAIGAIDLRAMVYDAGATSPATAVDHLLSRFLRVPAGEEFRGKLIHFLTDNLGTDNLRDAHTYLEDSLRRVLHLILSTPAYQLG